MWQDADLALVGGIGAAGLGLSFFLSRVGFTARSTVARAGALIAGSALMLLLFLVVPRTRNALDVFDIEAIAAAVLVLGAFFSVRRVQDGAIHAGVAVVYLQLLQSANRVNGYPDGEPWELLSVGWAVLIAALLWRRMYWRLALLPMFVGAGWVAFAVRQAYVPVTRLAAAGSPIRVTAVSKVSGDRIWAFACNGAIPYVAVFRTPAELVDLRVLLDGSGSMDSQIPNVPLPFRDRVRCAHTD